MYLEKKYASNRDRERSGSTRIAMDLSLKIIIYIYHDRITIGLYQK